MRLLWEVGHLWETGMGKRRIILKICAIPAGLLGAGLTLGGCGLGGWWLVVLGQGKSAAELPDPITILYPIIMIAVGVVLGWLLNLVPTVQGFIRPEYSAGLFAQALLAAIAVGVAGGLYPAWRAATLQPAEALRYE